MKQAEQEVREKLGWWPEEDRRIMGNPDRRNVPLAIASCSITYVTDAYNLCVTLTTELASLREQVATVHAYEQQRQEMQRIITALREQVATLTAEKTELEAGLTLIAAPYPLMQVYSFLAKYGIDHKTLHSGLFGVCQAIAEALLGVREKHNDNS